MFAIKRKESVVKAVRRSARERLDQAIAALNESPGDLDKSRAKVRSEVDRLLALLALVAPQMDTTAAQREGRVLRSASRRVQPNWDAKNYLSTRIKSAGNAFAKISAESVLIESQEHAKKSRNKRRCGPSPVVHRLIADLAEVRMRAGYWHVAGDGFDALVPGLRSTYTRARRLTQNTDHAHDTAAVLTRLADQLRWLERCWPGVMEAQRKRVSALAGLYGRVSLDQLLIEALNDGESATPLRGFLTKETASAFKQSERETRAMFSETPGRFLDRHAGYWAAWRGDDRPGG